VCEPYDCDRDQAESWELSLRVRERAIADGVLAFVARMLCDLGSIWDSLLSALLWCLCAKCGEC